MFDRIERVWRGLGTGFFLALIGLGGSAMALTVFPLIALLARDPERRRRRIQWVLHHSFRLYCGAIHALRIADIEICGAERLKALRGTLIVANHPSLLDVVMIMAAVPSVQCVVKGGLWKNPFFRLTVEGAGYIRNDLAPEDLMAACVATLRQGNNLIIFPEGTRTIPGEPMKARRGFANVATVAEANVQLVSITCEPPVLHKGNPWWRVPRRRSSFRLAVGDNLDIKGFLSYGFRPLAARKLVATVEQYYADRSAHGRTGIGNQATDRKRIETRGLVA